MFACPRTTRDMVAVLTLASFASSRYDVFFNVRFLDENRYRERGTGSFCAAHLPVQSIRHRRSGHNRATA